MKKRMLLVCCAALLLVGCDSEEEFKEQTNKEIQAQNQNLEARSVKLAFDLKKRRLFINAVEGKFEGEFVVKEIEYLMRIKITPTIPEYNTDRVQTLAELEYEIQNLALNVHVVQWNPDSNMSAVGCIFENIKPDSIKGVLELVAKSCSNSYSLYLTEDIHAPDNAIMRINMANQIRSGQINYIEAFKGELQSSTNGAIYKFNLNRI